MKNSNIILPLGIFAALLLSACGKHESAPQPDNSRRDTESSTRAEAPQGEAGSSTLPREKPLPKLVPVKSFSQQSAERTGFSQSTVPVSAGGGTNVTIIQNAAPQVQGTAVPAPEPAPKKPAARPVY